jgi:hypothetical protein
LEWPAQADIFRHSGGNQFVQIFETEGREHFARVGSVRPDVPADKFIRMFSQNIGQRHWAKIKFAAGKSEWDLNSRPVGMALCAVLRRAAAAQ